MVFDLANQIFYTKSGLNYKTLFWTRVMAHMSLAEAYIGLGQDQKARAHAEEMLKINPNYSLADERKRMYYYRDPTHADRHIDALRKAGLK